MGLKVKCVLLQNDLALVHGRRDYPLCRALTSSRYSLRTYLASVSYVALLTLAHPANVLAQIYGFGSNSSDVLGNTTAGNTISPQTPAISGATAVSASTSHVLALKADGTVWAWGANRYGELGSAASSTPSPTPAQVFGLTGVTAIAAGTNHSLALKSDGTVWAWGRNQYGQLGNPANSGTSNPNPAPLQVTGLTGVVAIAGLYNHCLALTRDGTVWAWGYNYYGQLGSSVNNGSATAANPTPAAIAAPADFVAVATGSLHSVAVRADGTVWAWGWNGYGQLGFTASNTANPTPLQIPNLSATMTIAAGANHTLAVRSDGTVWAWGYNNEGELGNGSASQYIATPVQAVGLSGITSVSGGDLHSMALRSDGTLWTWGFNAYGELGISTNFGTGNPNPTPAIVPNLSGLGGISGSTADSFAIIPAPVGITISATMAGSSFTVSGAGCQPGTYTTNATFNWIPGTSCTVTFPSSQTVGVGTQLLFKDWTDGPAGASRTIVVPAANTTYTAEFKTQYLLTVATSPSNTGSATGGGYYDANTSASVSAMANAGYVFSGWTGPVTSPASAATTVLMTAPQTVTANFAPSVITVTAGVTAANKTYDRTIAASITGCTVSGVQPADQGNVTCSAAGASFSDANAGPNKTVTATGITLTLTGSAVGKYGLSSTTATTTAAIMTLPITASVTAADKTYDATPSATINGCTLTGVIQPDNVTCSAASATFSSASAGKWAVTANGIVLGGAQAGNYSLNANSAAATATISKATAAISESAPSSSIYGQTVTLTVMLTPPAGTVPGGGVYLYYVRNASTSYICSNGIISTAPCTITVGPVGSGYGVSVATSQLPVGTESFVADYTGDANFNGGSATNLSVTVSRADSAIVLSKSADPSAYGDSIAFTVKVKDNTANSNGVPAGTVTLSFKLTPADPRIFNLCGDGSLTTASCVSGIVLGPDTTDPAGRTATATVTANRLPAGSAAYNYAYAISASYSGDGNFNQSAPYQLSQAVNQRPVTVTAASDTKLYDGTVASAGVPSVTGGTLLAGDKPSFTQVFDSRHAGSRTLTASGVVSDGFGGNNYSYLFNTAAGTINKATLTITAVTNARLFDGTIGAAAVPNYSGLLPGDTVTNLAESYLTPGVGTGKTLSVSAYTVNDGNGGGNYLVSSLPNNTGVISPFVETGTVSLSPAEQSYSGSETFTASLPIASVGGEYAAASVSFFICPPGTASPTSSCQNMTPVPAALAAAGGSLIGSATVNLLETVAGALAPGAHTVLAVFAPGPDFSLNIPSTSLQIDKKVTLPTGDTLYTGATTFWAPSDNSNNGTLYLSATVTDPCGAYPAGYAVCGDVSKGTLTFNILNGSTLTPIDGATNLPVGLVTPGVTTVGTAAAIVSFHPGKTDTVVIQMTVGSYFTGGDPSQNVVYNLSRSLQPGQMTLSASLLCCSTNRTLSNSGLIMGSPAQLTQLDGDVSSNKNGAGNKGTVTAQVVSMYKPDGTLDTLAHTYQIQSNTIAIFSTLSSGVANFTASATIQDITNPKSVVPVDNSALMQLTACAPGVSCPRGPSVTGNSGAIAIQVNNSQTGAVWFSSGWNGKQTVPQNASAGTVQIN